VASVSSALSITTDVIMIGTATNVCSRRIANGSV